MNTGKMRLSMIRALCKDAGIVDSKLLPVQRVELAFTKLKPKVWYTSRG